MADHSDLGFLPIAPKAPPANYGDLGFAPKAAKAAQTSDSEGPSVGSRALKNLPQSLLNFGHNAFPIGLDTLPSDPAQRHIRGPGEELGGILSNIGNLIFHPEESFAEDPVGTVGYPLMALKGGLSGKPGAFTKGAASEIHPLDLAGKVDLIHPLKMLGDMWDAAKGVYRGGVEGVQDYKTVQDIRQKMRQPGPTGTPTVGRFDPFQYDAPQSVPPIEVGGGHIPDYTGPTIQPVQPPAPSEISGRLSTGRFTPGQYDAPAPKPPAPSGYQSIKPIHPETVDISAALPDVSPAQGSPVSPNVARFKHGAEHTDLIRQNHATAAEFGMKHADLSKAAKSVYGVESYSHLSYPQLQALHEYLLKNKTLPVSPRDLLPE